MQNQSNLLITVNTQLKTALLCFSLVFVQIIWCDRDWFTPFRSCLCITVISYSLFNSRAGQSYLFKPAYSHTAKTICTQSTILSTTQSLQTRALLTKLYFRVTFKLAPFFCNLCTLGYVQTCPIVVVLTCFLGSRVQTYP